MGSVHMCVELGSSEKCQTDCKSGRLADMQTCSVPSRSHGTVTDRKRDRSRSDSKGDRKKDAGIPCPAYRRTVFVTDLIYGGGAQSSGDRDGLVICETRTNRLIAYPMTCDHVLNFGLFLGRRQRYHQRRRRHHTTTAIRRGGG